MSLHKRAGLFYTRVSPTNIERGVSTSRVKLQFCSDPTLNNVYLIKNP